MHKKLTVSVVVPVYNEEAGLEACLDHLLVQVPDVTEIVIIDNNSTDGTLALARHYADRWPQIKIVSEKQQGLIPARNRGFLEASGDIIAKIDADTWVCDGWAAAISQYFSEHPDTGGLNGRVYYYDLPCKQISAGISLLLVDLVPRIVGGTTFLYGPNMAIAAADAKKLAVSSCTDVARMNEDTDLSLHLAEAGRPIASEPNMLAAISGRRMKTYPKSFIPYVINWSRTFWLHRRWYAASLAFLLSLVYCALQALICLPLRAYNYENPGFSWRKLMAFNDRIIP